MPALLSVQQVRQALWLSAGMESGDGVASTHQLGRWFHETMSGLIGGTALCSPFEQLAELAPDAELRRQFLINQAYANSVGPRLTRERAALHDRSPQILSLWTAVEAACDWLTEVYGQLATEPQRRISHTTDRHYRFLTEQPLTLELREPGWSDTVRLTGVADAILHLPQRQNWCLLEFKLGQTSPVADLGQACLYHLMLSGNSSSAWEHQAAPSSGSLLPDSVLSVVSFHPERHERLFTAAELQSARAHLIDLIGKLAGVDVVTLAAPARTSSPVNAAAPSTAVRDSLAPSEEHLALGKGLVKTWNEYNVKVSLDQPVIAGSTFIRFPITLGRGTTVNAVSRYAAELQVRLGLREEPFISREDGQLVIDVQRPDRQIIGFDDIRGEIPAPDPVTGGSHVPIGVDLFRRLVCADLSKSEHAHLLVAGTTGSGKSEWLRLAIAGLLVTNTPQTLRLVVIDPKRNAFHLLRDSRYLWQPLVYPDEHSPVEVLEQLAEEMERRYRVAEGADNFQQMIARAPERFPRIVCVCDEYRDLVNRDPAERKELELQISRLGAKARAAGIHLILATQEASRETIRGPLDANMPARVGLKMGKGLESRKLLSEPGAEKLLGHGDLLFKDVGQPRRLQAPLLSEENRRTIFQAGT